MTQDDIIRMAEEARVHFENFNDRYIERLEKFAELVAAAGCCLPWRQSRLPLRDVQWRRPRPYRSPARAW